MVENETQIIELFKKGNSLRQIEKVTNTSYYKIVKLLEQKKLYKKKKVNRIKWTLELCEQLAQSIDGENAHCLSSTYINMHTLMTWKCKNEKHKPFPAELNSIYRAHSWCPECWNERKPEALTIITIEDCKNEAIKRGGICLSPRYKNGEKLLFQCEKGHPFKRTWDEVHGRNRWCNDPACNRQYRNQEICRQIFRAIFNKPFKQVKLSELNIQNAGKLEYDGYNDELKLAFEYNGELHYEIKFNNQDLETQKKNDEKKILLSKLNGITLVIVKFFPKESTLDRFKYIEDILKENNISYPSNYIPKIDLHDVYYDNYYEEIKQLIECKGGKLISKEILDATTKIDICCEKGHPFQITPHKLKSGEWCSHRALNRKLNDEEVKKTIQYYGGSFVKAYKQDKIYWVEYYCDEGHFQKKDVHRVRDGRWCNHEEHKGKRKREPYTERFDKYAK